MISKYLLAKRVLKMGKKIRMADIAQELGISVVSVSKGLAGKDGVSEEMRGRILEKAKELGYSGKTQPLEKPVSKQAKSRSIGILSADRFFDENTFYTNLYREILIQCTAQGDFAIMELVTPKAEHTCILPTIVTEKKVDALIFMGQIDRNYLETVSQCGLPYLLLDFYDDTLSADCVLSDNLAGGYQLTRYLLGKGFQKIGFIGSICATSSNMDRYLGVVRALLEAGITPKPEWRMEDRDERGIFIPFHLPQELPEAFICSCDEVAFNLVEYLTGKGIRVPEDVAVTGYDDYRYSTITRPPLTSYRVNVPGMARTAVKLIRQKLDGKPILLPKNTIPGKIIIRESTER